MRSEDDEYMDQTVQPGLVELTAKIVSAFVSNNTINAGEIPQLINDTHAALSRATAGQSLPTAKS